MFHYRHEMFARKVTPERIAATRAKFTRRRNQVVRRNEQVALFSELQEPLPSEPDPLDEIARADRLLYDLQIAHRAALAREWRAARKTLRAIADPLRSNILRHWNRGIYPGTPEYLRSLIRDVTTGRFDIDQHNRAVEHARELGTRLGFPAANSPP